MRSVDWTEVILAAISMLGTVASVYFARHSRRSAKRAENAARVSERPPTGAH